MNMANEAIIKLENDIKLAIVNVDEKTLRLKDAKKQLNTLKKQKVKLEKALKGIETN